MWCVFRRCDVAVLQTGRGLWLGCGRVTQTGQGKTTDRTRNGWGGAGSIKPHTDFFKNFPNFSLRGHTLQTHSGLAFQHSQYIISHYESVPYTLSQQTLSRSLNFSIASSLDLQNMSTTVSSSQSSKPNNSSKSSIRDYLQTIQMSAQLLQVLL